MTTPKLQAAANCQSVIHELEVAIAHLRDILQHLQQGEIPRYAAHLLATQGHLLNAQSTLNGLAVAHAGRSSPNAIPERQSEDK